MAVAGGQIGAWTGALGIKRPLIKPLRPFLAWAGEKGRKGWVVDARAEKRKRGFTAAGASA